MCFFEKITKFDSNKHIVKQMDKYKKCKFNKIYISKEYLVFASTYEWISGPMITLMVRRGGN